MKTGGLLKFEKDGWNSLSQKTSREHGHMPQLENPLIAVVIVAALQ